MIIDQNLIDFKVAFNQSFLESSGNLVNYAKFMGPGMKCDTSDPDSPKLGNSFFSLFATALETLCKPFPIIFDASSPPFH